MQERNNEEGVTPADLCHMIGKKIWYILGISALLCIIALLLTQFALNPVLTTYSLEFSITYPQDEDGKYPDGTPFSYMDLVSRAYLEEAKATDARFADLDLEKMITEDDIFIVAEQLDDEQQTLTGKYTLTVNGKYFSGRAEATDFIRAVINVPVTKIKAMASEVDCTLDESVFDAASFADCFSLLTEQKEELLSQYDEWISLYRENYTVLEKTLKNYRAEISVLFGKTTMTKLKEEMELCGYNAFTPADLTDETHLNNLIEKRRAELTDERNVNDKKIAALKEALALIRSEGSSIATVTSYTTTAATGTDEKKADATVTTVDITSEETLSQALAKLLLRNENIDYQLEMLTKENITAFKEKLRQEFTSLNQAAQAIKTVSSALYTQETKVTYTSSKANTAGDIDLPVMGVGSFLLVFLIGCTVVCVAAYPKYRRTQEEGAKEEPIKKS